MTMTREDMLRELELLPIWTLKKPSSGRGDNLNTNVSTLHQLETTQVPVEQSGIQSEDVDLIDGTELPITVKTESSPTFNYMASDDHAWIFLLSNVELSTDESLLLRNICLAMHIKTKPIKTTSNIIDLINENEAKLLIGMGEATAQHLLKSDASIDSLRGHVHDFHGCSLVVTYELKHLLKVALDKAKAWNDMCLALQTMQLLKSATSTQS